jgi:hypothetical protein
MGFLLVTIMGRRIGRELKGGWMNRIAFLVLLLCAFFGWAAHAVSGEFVAVEIEVFRPWGFLDWGSWEPAQTRFITSRTAPMPAEDAEGLAKLRSLCTDNTADIDREACDLVVGLQSVSAQSHALSGELGKSYRVVLRNLTDTSLGVVLAVDGLNSNGNAPIRGDESDRKWVLLPQQTVRVAGWQISENEALQFRFATPSKTHSPLTEERGGIAVYVYLPDPLGTSHARGTEAGAVIGQPTVRIPFASATSEPVESVAFDYSSDSVRLGILCTETDGPGIRIVGVIEGTIAEVKGLRTGDVITYADARPIDSCQDLGDLLATKLPGSRIVVKVHRAERVFLLTLELGT